jgi:hypothetical protein
MNPVNILTPTSCAIFRKMLLFTGLVSKLEDHPMLAVLNCLSTLFQLPSISGDHITLKIGKDIPVTGRGGP